MAQPDAGYAEGGPYELLGGFWAGEPWCFVNFEQFARLAAYWLETGSSLPADLDANGTVDMLDLERLVEEWLGYCPYDWPLQ